MSDRLDTTTMESALLAYADAKNHHDVDAVIAALHPEAYYESAGLPGRVEGHDALRAFYSAWFAAFPDYTGEFDGRAFGAEGAAVWGRFSGTMRGEFAGIPATGRRIEVPVTFVCTFRDGLVLGDTGYFDVASMCEQAGVPLEALRGPVAAAA